jgi:hypothetical protein
MVRSDYQNKGWELVGVAWAWHYLKRELNRLRMFARQKPEKLAKPAKSP